MRGKLTGILWRLGVFVAVCLFFTGAMFTIFAQLRVQQTNVYNAVFTNVSGLEQGQFVRIAGVEVGKVQHLRLQRDASVKVQFSADKSVVLTEGSRAVIRYSDLVGGRYVALEEGTGATAPLHPGQTIPASKTSPALDLDALIGGFRPLFRALDPDEVNALSGQLISAFEGQGGTIAGFFEQTAALTNMIADRDELIGEVIANLNTVLTSLADENTQFAKAVDSLAQLVSTLDGRREDLANSVAYSNAAAGSIADLLSQARPPLQKVVHEIDRTSAIVLADHDYVDNLIATLPEAYQILSRQGIYGDFFSFYACQVLLKVNGKGGQPVYVKMTGQPSGRCAPK
ncbi:MCE family protein [Mycolicibacterium hippocampi]|uniref:MCE family protein n=1 Tax=Mycolicibacterium hippocampi TaxID=659824 RepID=UPI003517DDF0